jgi:hypothetical protein
MKRLCICVLSISLLLPGQLALSYHKTDVDIESLDGSILFSFEKANEISGVSLAMADLGNDEVSEIVVGNGMGSEPRVFVLRQDGSEIGSFLAYAPTLGVGVNIVACDLTGDGYNEIAVAPQRGGGPHVRIFDRFGKAIDDGGFFAYDESMRSGVNLACGDLTDDVGDELVTLPASGAGPHVRVWNLHEDIQLVENFFAFHMDDRFGIIGAIDNKTLFLAQQHTTTPRIKTLVIHSNIETKSEIEVAIDGLGVASMIVHDSELLLTSIASPSLLNITQKTTSVLPINNAQLATNGDELFIAPGRHLFTNNVDTKRIEVDISEQRLYAFSRGILENSFLISSGLGSATPLGDHSVLAKVPLVHYAWNYGENDARNYDLGWIPYNLRIYPHIYIHYAPWHNNFGHQMSHGCINVSLANIQWVYDWAQEGISVEVRE